MRFLLLGFYCGMVAFTTSLSNSDLFFFPLSYFSFFLSFFLSFKLLPVLLDQSRRMSKLSVFLLM